MRDPDLVGRAQRAAMELERAWDRWRTMHGLSREPMPAVSSYVGYSLEEPWGQPRVVFGIEAREAEQLAALLDRHDCAGPVYAGLASMPGTRAEENAEFLSPATDRRRVIVPSQSPPGVAEREAAWREATWREAVPAEAAVQPAPQVYYPADYPAAAPGQQVATELPAAGNGESAEAAAVEPAPEDEPDVLEDGDREEAGQEDMGEFVPDAGPVPQARDNDQEYEGDEVGPEAADPAAGDQESASWRRPGRGARGRGLPRPKRSGGAAHGGRQ